MPDTDNGAEAGRGGLGPEDREALRKRAAELGGRIDEVKARRAPPVEELGVSKGASYAVAFRFVADLIAGVAVGGFIGWALDQGLATAPVFLAVFLVLGFAAGLLNIIRAAQRMQARNEAAQRAAPSLEDAGDED